MQGGICIPGDKQQETGDKRGSWECVHGEATAKWVELCSGWLGTEVK